MVFAVVGGDGKPTGYEIDNSVRFNQGDHCLTQNFSGTESSNRKKWTFSVWFKRSNLITSAALFTAGSSGQDEMTIRLEGHKINWQEYKVSNTTMIGELITNQVLRDVAAWYHLVCRWDSTDSTAGDRMKMFLNGVEITSFSTDNNPSENYDSMASNSVLHNIGRQSWNNAGDFDGYMADVNFVEGLSLDPSYFGETNDNGVWVPKEPDVSSYGNNGFFLEFQQTGTSQNSSGIGADTSGNDNHFAIDSDDIELGSTTDTPTNNFATMNPLTAGSNLTLREGNLQQYAHSSSDSAGCAATIMPDSGKWYIELYLESPSGGDYPFFGITDTYNLNRKGTHGTKLAAGFEIDGATNNQSTTNFGSITNTNTGWPSFSDNDIVQFALDLDNRKLWLGRNGTYINSGNPASGSNAQLAWTISDNTSVMMLGYDGSGGGGSTSRWNFGNPVFSISSGNADANGYGNFEYAPPSGYYALCTKNLAEYG